MVPTLWAQVPGQLGSWAPPPPPPYVFGASLLSLVWFLLFCQNHLILPCSASLKLKLFLFWLRFQKFELLTTRNKVSSCMILTNLILTWLVVFGVFSCTHENKSMIIVIIGTASDVLFVLVTFLMLRNCGKRIELAKTNSIIHSIVW